MQPQPATLSTQYDQPISNIIKVNQLLQKIANKQSLQDLADLTTQQDYLQLLVKQYYSKIKDTLAGKYIQKQRNPLQVDKQAVMRMIKNGIRQDVTESANK